MEAVFWACLALAVYTYCLYPVLLFLAWSLAQMRRDWRYLTGRSDRRAAAPSSGNLPAVTLMVPAYNEEKHLAGKLANIRELDYPADKLRVVFVSDGSTDRTNEILAAASGPNLETIFLARRWGKPTALNHGAARAGSEILVMSDAATLFEPDAIRCLVRHFSDPSVGVACGALQFQASAESRQTEGLYWKYESMLRLMEGRLGATLTASGAIYALRRECYRPLAENTLIEDFVIPLHARRLGFRVVYDPEARGTEFAAATVAGEFTRRVRLAVGSFSALGEMARYSWQGFAGLAFVSHKVLRWIFPFLLIGLLASNLFLLDSPLYQAAFLGQAIFYLWASLGFLLRRRVQGARYALVGYFLLAMNVAFLVGFVRFLAGREEASWQRVS